MILDSDILIDLVRRHPPALAWFAALTTLPAISGYAAFELLAGCRNTGEVRQAQRLLYPLTVLWVTEAELNSTLASYAPLRLAHGIGVLDALIAATAKANGLPLATFNTRHFRAIPGLTLVQPYTR